MLAFPAVATLLCSGSAYAQNLLSDGSFEALTLSGSSGYAPSVSWKTLDVNTGTVFDGVFVGKVSFGTTAFTGGWLDAIEDLPGVQAAMDGNNFHYNSADHFFCFQDVVTVSGSSYTLTGLLGNGEIAAGQNGTLGAIAAVFVDGVAAVSHLEGDWSNFSHTFTAATNSTRISFGFVQGDGPASQVMGVDNLSLVASVPEPSSALLLALGSLGLIARRRR